MHAEDFARVRGRPGAHGKGRVGGEGAVEELEAAVAARGQELVLVRFGPGQVEDGVLRFVPAA